MKDRTTLILVVLLALAIVAEFFAPHSHAKFFWHSWPGHMAGLALLGFVFLSVITKAVLAFLIQRGEEVDER
jgi:uncharacterized membrane protein